MGRAYQNRKESMAKTAAAKTKVYSRYGREIYMAAKSGSPDPAMNAVLKAIIDRAKKDQVPTHVVDRAIDKAKGGGGEDYAPARFEGYGPGGSMVIVECLTDNTTRTFNEVRSAFNKNGAKLGNAGAVAHMFDHSAIFVFKGHGEDDVLEALLGGDVDVTDVEEEDGVITVFTPNNEYGNAKKALVEAFGELDFEVDEIQFVPKDMLTLEGEDAAMFTKFTDIVDELDDVQKIFHNVQVA